MTESRNTPNDPAGTAHAWRRFRNLMWAMGGASVVAAGVALVWLNASYGSLSWVAVLATIGGVGGSMMLAAALMGLMFLSADTGLDDSAAEHQPPEEL